MKNVRAALRVPLVVTWLTVYRQLHIPALGARKKTGSTVRMCCLATYFSSQLRIPLSDLDETLHASLYLYILGCMQSGVSVVISYAEKVPQVRSNSESCFKIFMIS